MKKFEVFSKELTEKQFMDAIMEANKTANVSVLVEEGIYIPFSRNLEVQPMGWNGLVTIRAFDDLNGETSRVEIPEVPETIYVFGEDIKEIKVIIKNIKTDAEFMDAIMEAYKTVNSTVVVESGKAIPFENAKELITTSTGWDGLAAITLFKDAVERLHVFDMPQIPEVMYVFDFE